MASRAFALNAASSLDLALILKSDGASLYNTTDLATIMERMRLYDPDEIIYITDKRQDLYFEQVFRCARKTKLVKPETLMGRNLLGGALDHGVELHQRHLQLFLRAARRFQREGREMPEEEAKAVAETVALSALKYGDLSNQAAKDYVFDIDRFTSFEGDTGPYILYTIVRIKSILNKYKEHTQNLGLMVEMVEGVGQIIDIGAYLMGRNLLGGALDHGVLKGSD